MNKRLLFSCSFGKQRGWGHIVRCSAIAEQAHLRGYETHLCSPNSDTGLPVDITQHFSHTYNPNTRLNYTALILDIPTATELDLIPFQLNNNAPIIVIDDECKRDLAFADIIVNPALDAQTLPYPHTVYDQCLGETYALVRSPFRIPPPSTSRAGIALVMGGTDVLSLIPQILDSITHNNSMFKQTPILLITPTHPTTQAAIEDRSKQATQLTWLPHANAQQIATTFQRAQLGITACGGAAYEMASCGLRFVGIVVAENQRKFAHAIHNQWQFPVIDGAELSSTKLLNALQGLALSSHQPSTPHIDGHGATRLLDKIEKALRCRSAL